MRKRKLAQTRIDKLTGSMDTLDVILHRIQEAESNEMVSSRAQFCTHHYVNKLNKYMKTCIQQCNIL